MSNHIENDEQKTRNKIQLNVKIFVEFWCLPLQIERKIEYFGNEKNVFKEKNMKHVYHTSYTQMRQVKQTLNYVM